MLRERQQPRSCRRTPRAAPPPLSEREVEKIAASIAQYPPAAGETGAALVHEAAHAEVLRAAWLGLFRWADHEKSWRHWNGRVWERAAEPVVVAAAQKELRRHYGLALAERQTSDEDKRLRTLHTASCKYGSVRDGLAFLKGEDGFFTRHEEWDADLDTLNCADGLLDLNTQTLRAHDPAALLHHDDSLPLRRVGEEHGRVGAAA